MAEYFKRILTSLIAKRILNGKPQSSGSHVNVPLNKGTWRLPQGCFLLVVLEHCHWKVD